MRNHADIAQMLTLMAVMAATWHPLHAAGWSNFGGTPWAATRGKKRWKRLRRCR
jgi:hypothetical protein